MDLNKVFETELDYIKSKKGSSLSRKKYLESIAKQGEETSKKFRMLLNIHNQAERFYHDSIMKKEKENGNPQHSIKP